MTKKERLVSAYSYKNTIVSDPADFKKKVACKTILPYQVEFQAPPASRREICWLKCPYCYGRSADDSQSPRMSKDLALNILEQIAKGGVKKIIFAGYATDPLNCNYADDLLEKAISEGVVYGFNTKGLRISERFFELLSAGETQPSSYISFSVDAGSNDTYNRMHAVSQNVKLYDKVLENVRKCCDSNRNLDVSAAYLINKTNDQMEDIKGFIRDFRNAGCKLLRLSFLQKPRGYELNDEIMPGRDYHDSTTEKLEELVKRETTEKCIVQINNIDGQSGIFEKARSLPCFARFIFPTVGYDGWLYHCSQSSAPNFHKIALGDLSKNGFWDLYYNYDVSNFSKYLSECSDKLTASGCRCDRKMHLANMSLAASGIFTG